MAASSQQSMAQSPSPRQRTGFIERPVFRIAPEDVCLPNRPGPHGLRGHALVARRETPGHRIYSLFTMSNTREPPEAVREFVHPPGASRHPQVLMSFQITPEITPQANGPSGSPPDPWWSQTGSNRRPHACKARALPTELWPLVEDGLGGINRVRIKQ